jgi:phosphoglycerate kinase
MTSFRTLDDLGDVHGSKALVRVDLNVPMADGEVTPDDYPLPLHPADRHRACDRARIVLPPRHFGRPRGEKRPDMSLSLVTRA